MALTTEQLEAVELLANPLEKKTKAAIAKQVGVCRATLWSWTKDPSFTQALNDRISEYIAPLRASAMACLQRAIETGDVVAAKAILQVSGDIGSGTNVVTNIHNQTKPEELPERIREWREARELVDRE